MLRNAVIALLSLLCLSACFSTTRSLSWKSGTVAIGQVKSLMIQPVVNATGGALNEEVLRALTRFLREQLKATHLLLTASDAEGSDSLTVQSAVLEYKFQFFSGPPPPSGQTSGLCIVRTHLRKMPENILVAEILTFNKVDVGQGLLEHKTPDPLLRETAAAIVREMIGLL